MDITFICGFLFGFIFGFLMELLIKSIIELKDNKYKHIALNTKEVPNDEDVKKYMYSLQFNMKLDKMIRPLLSKYSDYDIINNLYSQLVISDPNCQKIDERELKDYLVEVLKSYNNYYQEESIIEDSLPNIDESLDSSQKEVTDLFNVFQNFYKD